MDCGRVRQRLSALLDEDLPQVEASALRRHLLGCNDCRMEFGSWLRMRTALSSLAPQPDPARDAWFAGLEREILAKVAAAEEQTAPRRLQWVGAVAAAVLLFALGLHFGIPEQGSELLRGPSLTETGRNPGSGARTEAVGFDTAPRGSSARARVLDVPVQWVRTSAVRRMSVAEFTAFAVEFQQARGRRVLADCGPFCPRDFQAFAERSLRRSRRPGK